MEVNKVKQISISLDWIPPAILRGNSRAHYHRKAKAVRYARLLGESKARNFVKDWIKIQGKIGVEINVFHQRNIDLDNLLIGFKPIIDGFVDSGLIDDDRNIKEMLIKLNRDKQSKSVITIISLGS